METAFWNSEFSYKGEEMKWFEVQIKRKPKGNIQKEFVWEVVQILTVAESDYVKDYSRLMECFMNYQRNNPVYDYRLVQVLLETRSYTERVNDK